MTTRACRRTLHASVVEKIPSHPEVNSEPPSTFDLGEKVFSVTPCREELAADHGASQSGLSRLTKNSDILDPNSDYLLMECMLIKISSIDFNFGKFRHGRASLSPCQDRWTFQCTVGSMSQRGARPPNLGIGRPPGLADDSGSRLPQNQDSHDQRRVEPQPVPPVS